jgi:hypothetical protein
MEDWHCAGAVSKKVQLSAGGVPYYYPRGCIKTCQTGGAIPAKEVEYQACVIVVARICRTRPPWQLIDVVDLAVQGHERPIGCVPRLHWRLGSFGDNYAQERSHLGKRERLYSVSVWGRGALSPYPHRVQMKFRVASQNSGDPRPHAPRPILVDWR